ncbi:hypothetical protein THAOC_30633 [Thalassiosira oceanica]|uniref:Uncharacterized protein n=1 Tax=Thalassiosira oceanica TaxID=159749 RepID=K0R9V1_THAOC|nr:hypothetical protein THAOC_30633 [Thalassiosira oceanica]|eukprot:EJK50403.1 hypothetical protein THAOC_30633 [Thalassiosira oceanica]
MRFVPQCIGRLKTTHPQPALSLSPAHLGVGAHDVERPRVVVLLPLRRDEGTKVDVPYEVEPRRRALLRRRPADHRWTPILVGKGELGGCQEGRDGGSLSSKSSSPSEPSPRLVDSATFPRRAFRRANGDRA